MLADALSEAGDPRGELITLQLALAEGRGDDRAVRRTNELLTEHASHWSAGFPGLKPRVKFRRGFPYRVETNAKGTGLDKTLDRPEWATVEELEINGVDADLPRLLARMPLLRVLVAPREVLEELAASGVELASIRTIGGGGWVPRDLRAFPNLAVIAGRWLTYQDTAELEEAQHAAARLRLDATVHHCMVHVPGHITDVVASRGAGPHETRCAVLNTHGGGLEHQGWYVQTWRERDDALVGWHASSWFETETARRILEPLAELGFKRIAFAVPLLQRARHKDAMEALRRELERRGCELVEGAGIDILAPARGTIGA